MSGKIVLLLALLSYAHYTAFAKPKNVVCYYTNWTTYRNGNGQFKVVNIDTNLCTHIFYAFEGLTADGTFKLIDEWGDISLNQIQDIISLKLRKPSLKILVSVGGYNEGSARFSAVASSGTARANFISTSLAAIQKYGFDGLDLVWEYPGSGAGSPSDKENFARLIQEASTTFKAHNLLLTAAVAPVGDLVDRGYNIPVLSKNLDMITLMDYDFHGYYDGYTGSNSPLYNSPADTTGNHELLNANASVNYWISHGADPQKLILGTPFYGKSYKLTNKARTGLGVPVSGPGPIGPYTQQSGVLGYNEICELQNEGGWTIVWEDNQKVPYMYKDDIWISYDDVRSMKSKVEYAKSKNLLGLSVWSLGIDDFRGTCKGKPNVLLTAINDAMAF